MLNFNVQLNNIQRNEVKTVNEIVEEAFSVKKPIVDVSFFYRDKEKTDYPNHHINKEIKDVKDVKIKTDKIKVS